jgi:hypothetical protein
MTCVAPSQTDRRRLGVHPAVRRVVASAGVAGGLGLVLWLVTFAGSRSHVTSRLTCGGDTGGCLELAIIGSIAALLAIVILAWPLLYAARVRPAWPVALIGPVVALVASREYLRLADSSLLTSLWLVLAISYAAAAVISAPRLYRYWSGVVALGVVALYVLNGVAGSS